MFIIHEKRKQTWLEWLENWYFTNRKINNLLMVKEPETWNALIEWVKLKDYLNYYIKKMTQHSNSICEVTKRKLRDTILHIVYIKSEIFSSAMTDWFINLLSRWFAFHIIWFCSPCHLTSHVGTILSYFPQYAITYLYLVLTCMLYLYTVC